MPVSIGLLILSSSVWFISGKSNNWGSVGVLERSGSKGVFSGPWSFTRDEFLPLVCSFSKVPFSDRQVVWFSAMALSIFLFLLQIEIAILHNDLMTFWAIGVTLPQRCLKLSYNKKVLGQLLTRKIAPNPKPVLNPNTSPNPNRLINLINLIHKQNVFY